MQGDRVLYIKSPPIYGGVKDVSCICVLTSFEVMIKKLKKVGSKMYCNSLYKVIYYIQNYSFGGVHMANKTANVTARVQPEIKKQAEAVLEKIGIPVSVLIDTLYRQIIMTGSVPYSLSVPKVPTLDSMSEEQFDAMMQKGYDEAKAGIGLPVNEAFDKIREVI